MTALRLLSLILVGIAAVSQEAAKAEELIAEADAAFDRWTEPFEFVAYRNRLETAVALWEQALPLLPEDDASPRAHVLNRLAEAHSELGEAYLVEPAAREEAYGNGVDYAVASLQLDPLFGETEKADGFRAAPESASAVEATFWYGNTVGVRLNYQQITAILGSARRSRLVRSDDRARRDLPGRRSPTLDRGADRASILRRREVPPRVRPSLRAFDAD